jgi:hypothetical protein
MQTRERILAFAFGALVVGYGGNWLFETALQGPLDRRRSAIAREQKKIQSLEAKLGQARKAGKELAEWEAQSLPSDVSQARRLYQAWLTDMINQIGLSDLSFNAGTPVSRKGYFNVVSFAVRGRGTLAQLVELLFEFYSADHLHQIQKLDITPSSQDSNLLDLSISIEALALPGADRREQLSTRTSHRLASATLADYQSIVKRNLFRFGGTGADATDYTYLTAVIDVNDQLEAWFTSRNTGDVVKLHQGDSIDIGQFRGTIIDIQGSDIVVQSEDDERWLLTVGENLAQASALPPEF